MIVAWHRAALVVAMAAVLVAGACCRARDGAMPAEGLREAVDATLDGFHQAAANADEESYFALFAPEGVFLGTDGAERWTLAEFRDFAEPYFQGRSAWVFTPGVRHVVFSPGGKIASFDESLLSATYGECRGTGVLRLIDGRWRIVQYSLSIPIPNAMARDVVEQIRATGSGG